MEPWEWNPSQNGLPQNTGDMSTNLSPSLGSLLHIPLVAVMVSLLC